MGRVVLTLKPPKTVFYKREGQSPQRVRESPAPRRDPYQHFDRGPSILDRSLLQSHQRTRFGLRLRDTAKPLGCVFIRVLLQTGQARITSDHISSRGMKAENATRILASAPQSLAGLGFPGGRQIPCSGIRIPNSLFGRENSLFGKNNSLFRQKNSLFHLLGNLDASI